MGTSRKRALEYAYELLERPRAHLRVELRQVSDGVVLKHGNRVLTKVYLNRSGMNAAVAMAEALGIHVPPAGQGVVARVSTGLLYRVPAISQLDFTNETSFEMASKLIEEADEMRGSGSDA